MGYKRIGSILLAIGSLTAILSFSACGSEGAGGAENHPSPAAEPEELPVSLRVLCAGDVMVHEQQLAAQWDAASGVYDFSGNFEYVKEYVSAADLALCNLETTLGGEPYTGYPLFSSPDSLAVAIAGAGFDAVFTSNNHMLDRGADGLFRTLETATAAGLRTAGSRGEGEAPGALVRVAEGIVVGLVSFTYESPRAGANRTLNGIRVKAGIEPLINSFGFEDLDGDLERVSGDIRRVREDGADIVVCYFHWGDEYERSPNDYQRYIASRAAISGADVIFASHPHVPQGFEYLRPGPDRAVPVFYSLGNFISNQRFETRGDRFTEQGIMAVADVRIMRSDGEILSVEAKALPTWVDRYRSGGKNVYAIVPLVGDFENNPALVASGHADRARQALDDMKELLGEEVIYGQ
jgi:poly-gamma-glutamate synthesis protein (capsule biosynthesis protein)